MGVHEPTVGNDVAHSPVPSGHQPTTGLVTNDRYWRTLGIIGFVVLAALACLLAVGAIRQIRAGNVCSQRGGESYTEDAALVGPIPSVRCITTWTNGDQVVDRQQVWMPFVPLVAVLGFGGVLDGRRRRRRR